MSKGCVSCIRIVMIVFNAIFVLFGFAIGILGTYFLIKSGQIMPTTQFAIMLYVIIGVGLLTIILGIFGCCGACYYSRCLLGTFFFLLLVVFAAEIACGVVGFMMQTKISDEMKSAFDQAVSQRRKDSSSDWPAWIDFVQVTMKCCGSSGPLDYGTGIPKSCCNYDDDVCQANTVFTAASAVVTKEGCATKIDNFFKNNFPIVCAIILSIALLELIVLVFSMVLCCNIRVTQYEAVVVA